MANDNLNIFPEPGESAEQHAHRVREILLGENWLTRFQGHGAAYRALGAELADTKDPDKIVVLTELRGESLVRGLGSGAISLWQRDELAERQALEDQFGQDTTPEQH